MIATRTQAVANANARISNKPGTCQLVTRGYYNAPSAGDRDRDGDADAVDGWVSEPASKRHTDRTPPPGVPVAWSGGRNGFGHRAIVVGYYEGEPMVRSTDAPSSGITSTVPLSWIEAHWGLHYLGWSETITGWDIPDDTKPTKPVKEPRYTKVSRARRLTERALIRLEAAGKGKSPRARALRKALRFLPER